MTDAYGLAYMTAKNVIGPVSIALFYAALKYGVDLRGALASAGVNVADGPGFAAAAAGKRQARSRSRRGSRRCSSPLSCSGAGFIGPKMGRAREGGGAVARRGGAEARAGRPTPRDTPLASDG